MVGVDKASERIGRTCIVELIGNLGVLRETGTPSEVSPCLA